MKEHREKHLSILKQKYQEEAEKAKKQKANEEKIAKFYASLTASEDLRDKLDDLAQFL